MLDEINKKARKTFNTDIKETTINDAFDAVIKNSDYFEEWKNRLFSYFPTDESDFMNEILTYIGHEGIISPQKLYDLAVKHKQTRQYMTLIDGLERDGYITEQNQNYVFVSPFLKAYWKRSNPIYHA